MLLLTSKTRENRPDVSGHFSLMEGRAKIEDLRSRKNFPGIGELGNILLVMSYPACVIPKTKNPREVSLTCYALGNPGDFTIFFCLPPSRRRRIDGASTAIEVLPSLMSPKMSPKKNRLNPSKYEYLRLKKKAV